MIDLGDFLKSVGHRRRVAGEWDCCTFPAAWAIANGWSDPMRLWRGTYSTDEDGERFISDAGGLACLFDVGMADVGIPQAINLVPGVIGVLRVGEHEAGGIFTGKRWALVADRGLAFGSVGENEICRMWSVDHG